MSDTEEMLPPEARLKEAGFSQRLGFWVTPDGASVLHLNDAIAGLDSGEIQPGGQTFCLPDSGIRALPDELVERICPPPQNGQPQPPPWLVAQAEVIAEATVAKLKPLIRAEVRAALRKAGKS